MQSIPFDCDELFTELYNDIVIVSNKLDLFLAKIEKLINKGTILPRIWYKDCWFNILDSLNSKDVFINGNYNKSNKLLRLYLDKHSKTVACKDWIYYGDVIQGSIHNFNFSTSKIIKYITIEDINKNISTELFGTHIENWNPPSLMAVQTNSNSIYFLAPLNEDVKLVEEMAIKQLKQKCEVIHYK